MLAGSTDWRGHALNSMAAAVCLVTAIGLVVEARQAGTASISGRVVIAGGVEPAVDAVVTLASDQSSTAITTGERGEFSFTNLRPGEYFVTASKERYLTVTHGQKRVGSADPGVRIRLTDGARVERVQLALPLAGVISGRVTSRQGEPLQGAVMSALRIGWRGGERSLSSLRTDVTDDRGEYRLVSLVPGDYVISARPPTRASDGTPATIYYPATVSAGLATPITLGLSELRAGTDFELSRVALARVSGTALGANGRPLGSVMVQALDLAPALGGIELPGTYAGDDGRFALIAMPPGRFRLVGAHEFGMCATTDVVVADRDVTDVPLRFLPCGSVSGRVVVEERGGAAASGVSVSVFQPEMRAPTRIPVPSARSDASGRFSIRGVREGTARLLVARIPTDLAVAGMRLNGRDVWDLPFDVAQSEELTDLVITLTTRRTSLAGTLSDARNQPTSDHLVIAYAADERAWFPGSPRIVTTRPGTDGRFVFTGLPPGTYGLAALTDAEDGQWFDPAFLKTLAAASLTVTLRPGEQATQNVRLRGPG